MAKREQQHIRELIKKHGYELRDIFNMDETGLFYGMPPDRGLADKKFSGVKGRKAHYGAKYIQRAINHYEAGITPSEIYDINQLQAMRLADVAWYPAYHGPSCTSPAHSSSLVTSLCNINVADQNPVSNAKNEVRNALDDLQATGVLQPKNRMDIKALLNPPEESQMMDEVSNEDICRAVLVARNAQEEGPINGGDDDIEDDSPLEPCPTHHEVFQAASVINRYIEHLDDPIAHKLEAILASFRHEIHLEESRSMSATHLTDYSTCI
ncbi:hypothetical protein BDR07DRAFT_1494994 [Suillus spraguei]|nr:hypothetical protein BDR07DRAFT_1494994 [Suillus spraguei]